MEAVQCSDSHGPAQSNSRLFQFQFLALLDFVGHVVALRRLGPTYLAAWIPARCQPACRSARLPSDFVCLKLLALASSAQF